jgi:hypothetical protein
MRRRTPAPADSAPSPAVWPKVACGGLLLAVAVALAGCSSGHSLKAATAHGRSPGASASGGRARLGRGYPVGRPVAVGHAGRHPGRAVRRGTGPVPNLVQILAFWTVNYFLVLGENLHTCCP